MMMWYNGLLKGGDRHGRFWDGGGGCAVSLMMRLKYREDPAGQGRCGSGTLGIYLSYSGVQSKVLCIRLELACLKTSLIRDGFKGMIIAPHRVERWCGRATKEAHRNYIFFYIGHRRMIKRPGCRFEIGVNRNA